jgi:spoIIIJ-associated protein
MEPIIQLGDSYQTALDAALDELSRDESEVEIEVLEEGDGTRPWKIRVTPVDGPLDEAQDWLLDVLDAMGIDGTVGLVFEGDRVVFHIELEGDPGILIGRRGQTLEALQWLLSVSFGNRVGRKLLIDVEDYRQRAQERISRLALDAADRARKSGRPQHLPPMNAAERRLVHHALVEELDIETQSEGRDPDRHVVIQPRQVR